TGVLESWFSTRFLYSKAQRPDPHFGRPQPKLGCRAIPMTNLGGLCLELLSGKGLESAFLEEIGLKHETVFCHHGVVFSEAPMETRTVPWLHSVRLPPRGHLPNRHNGEPSVLSRSLARCVSFLTPEVWKQVKQAASQHGCRLQAERAPLWETSGDQLSGCGAM